jgi:hypothetical protein
MFIDKNKLIVMFMCCKFFLAVISYQFIDSQLY